MAVAARKVPGEGDDGRIGRLSVITREFWIERYTWMGVVYLLVVSALHWSRGGPPGAGAVSDLLAFYGTWYAIGFLLLALGWWRAARRDGATP